MGGGYAAAAYAHAMGAAMEANRKKEEEKKGIISKEFLLSNLADMTSRLGEARLEENGMAARDLFRDSARKYAHSSMFAKKKSEKVELIEKALVNAKRSEDPKITYELVMGYTKVLNGEEYVPRTPLSDEPDGKRGAERVMKIMEKREDAQSSYFYKIEMSNGEFESLVNIAEGIGKFSDFLRKSEEGIATIKYGNADDQKIAIHYNWDESYMVIWSRHDSSQHETVTETINSVGATLELLITS